MQQLNSQLENATVNQTAKVEVNVANTKSIHEFKIVKITAKTICLDMSGTNIVFNKFDGFPTRSGAGFWIVAIISEFEIGEIVEIHKENSVENAEVVKNTKAQIQVSVNSEIQIFNRKNLVAKAKNDNSFIAKIPAKIDAENLDLIKVIPNPKNVIHFQNEIQFVFASKVIKKLNLLDKVMQSKNKDGEMLFKRTGPSLEKICTFLDAKFKTGFYIFEYTMSSLIRDFKSELGINYNKQSARKIINVIENFKKEYQTAK